MKKIVICLPTYNERENVALIIPEIFSVVPEHTHVLVVDDNSPDGTAEVVRELMKQYPRLDLYSRARKEGLGRAYVAAFQRVLGDASVEGIMTMDADGSHAAEYLPEIIKQGENSDVVIGSRYTRGGGIENWEQWRMYLSRFGNIYARLLTGIPARDLTAGFILMRASALRTLDLAKIGASGYAFLIDLKFQLSRIPGIRFYEVPIIFKSRREGESKISGHIIREGLRTPWRLFFQRFQ